MTRDNDFIEIYDDSAPQKLCYELVKWFDLCSDKKFTYHNMPFIYEESKPTLRSDEAIAVPNVSVSSYSLSNEICNAYWNVLYKCLNNYVEKYDLNNLHLSCHQFKLHRVKEGQGYHVWHYENDGLPDSCQRVLAWMTYLRVPEKGGETEFLCQSKRIEPVVGRTLIWPAYFTHLHRGNPPLKGEKHYITGWFENGIEFTPTGE